MSGYRRRHAQFRLHVQLARQRVEAVLRCVNELSPDLGEARKRDLANSILTLFDGIERTLPHKQITDAQAVAMVWEHSQCLYSRSGKCPLLVFGRELANELNAFFLEVE